MKYHKEIYFRPEDKQGLELLNNFLSRKKFTWSLHAKENISRVNNILFFYNWYNIAEFDIENIIEYTIEAGQIKKVLYRLQYDETSDILFSISKEGNIITLWFNNSSDKHKTLNPREYSKFINNFLKP
jgi:hypothetical protein